jgi:hypothetical protein
MCTSHEALRAEVDDSARRLKEADRCHEALTERVEVLEKALRAVYEDLGAWQNDNKRNPVDPHAYHLVEQALAAPAQAGQPPYSPADEQFQD